MKIGVVGSGKIVREFLETLPSLEQLECIAICARPESEPKAQILAEEFGIRTVYIRYSEMLEDSAVDFIYIGVVNALHGLLTREALLAGKHVIVEKPFTTTAEEARELMRLAVEKKLFLFEAITTLYAPMFKIMQERLPDLGEVRMVQCNFSQYSSRYGDYLAGEIHPVFDPAGKGGALYDINVYNLHLVTALFGKPEAVRYHGNRGYNGVDTSGMAVLRYPGFAAVCSGAKDSSSPGFAMIQGTRGYLHMKGNPNACPALEVEIDGIKESFHDPDAQRRLMPELAAFERMWREGALARCHELLAHSVLVVELLEQAMATN